MFDLTILSFNIADKYRIPVLLMADEVVGHMAERVIIPAADEIPFVGRKKPAHAPAEGYRVPPPEIHPARRA